MAYWRTMVRIIKRARETYVYMVVSAQTCAIGDTLLAAYQDWAENNQNRRSPNMVFQVHPQTRFDKTGCMRWPKGHKPILLGNITCGRLHYPN